MSSHRNLVTITIEVSGTFQVASEAMFRVFHPSVEWTTSSRNRHQAITDASGRLRRAVGADTENDPAGVRCRGGWDTSARVAQPDDASQDPPDQSAPASTAQSAHETGSTFSECTAGDIQHRLAQRGSLIFNRYPRRCTCRHGSSGHTTNQHDQFPETIFVDSTGLSG